MRLWVKGRCTSSSRLLRCSLESLSRRYCLRVEGKRMRMRYGAGRRGGIGLIDVMDLAVTLRCMTSCDTLDPVASGHPIAYSHIFQQTQEMPQAEAILMWLIDLARQQQQLRDKNSHTAKTLVQRGTVSMTTILHTLFDTKESWVYPSSSRANSPSILCLIRHQPIITSPSDSAPFVPPHRRPTPHLACLFALTLTGITPVALYTCPCA